MEQLDGDFKSPRGSLGQGGTGEPSPRQGEEQTVGL